MKIKRLKSITISCNSNLFDSGDEFVHLIVFQDVCSSNMCFFFPAFNVEGVNLSLLRRTSAIVALQTHVMSRSVGTALAQRGSTGASDWLPYPEEAPLRADLLLSMRSLRGEVFEGLWFL